jgi:hypothetical protein
MKMLPKWRTLMAKKTAGSAAVAMETANGIVSTNGVSRTQGKITRTTLVIPETLDQNLELYALQAGLPKGEVVKRVLIDFLTAKGLQPDKRPRSINVSY